jgi:hypothetical protein
LDLVSYPPAFASLGGNRSFNFIGLIHLDWPWQMKKEEGRKPTANFVAANTVNCGPFLP